MMFGNVAPAPLSFTWAAAGAASARPAASASRGDFVIGDPSSGLERELHLEEPLRPGSVLQRTRSDFVRQIVDVHEHSQVRGHLVGDATDDARLSVSLTL